MDGGWDDRDVAAAVCWAAAAQPPTPQGNGQAESNARAAPSNP